MSENSNRQPRHGLMRSLKVMVASVLTLVVSAVVLAASPPGAQAATYSDSYLSQFVEFPAVYGAKQPLTLVVQESTSAGALVARFKASSLEVWWPGAMKYRTSAYEGSLPAIPVVISRTLQRLTDDPSDGVALVRWHDVETHVDDTLITDAQFRSGAPVKLDGLTFETRIPQGSNAAPYRVTYRVDWVDARSLEVAASVTVMPSEQSESRCDTDTRVSCWATGGHVVVG